MEKPGRLVWCSFSERVEERERKALDALAEFRPVVLRGFREVGEFPFGYGDVIVADAEREEAPLVDCIGRIASDYPDLRILLRTDLDGDEPELARRWANVRLLDRFEGPDLTRARVKSAMGEQRKSGKASVCAIGVPDWRRKLIGVSFEMEKVAEIVRLIGPRRCTVLITGETGTGKEVVARAIHDAGPRRTEPFIGVNCSAIPSSLLEAELFGHTRGAFTGAAQAREGRLEQAGAGTLFLDEIGDLPLELQAKLLRVLQEREFQRLGSSENVQLEARVIAATNCDLQAKMREGTFREDLYYRLNVVPVALPPLRARVADIRVLGQHFLERACEEERIAIQRVTPAAWMRLEQYDWPGNVRQLQNAITSAVILSEDRPYLDEDDFAELQVSNGITDAAESVVLLPQEGLDFTRTVMNIERHLLSQALKKTGGNKKAAADMLQLKRTTLAAKIRVLELAQDVA